MNEPLRVPYQRRNVLLLALCQAAGMSCSVLMITVTALVGGMLAPDPLFATLPLGLQWLSVIAFATPGSFLMKHYGRRLGLSLGAALGILAGSLGTWAILQESFLLFCLTSVPFGALVISVQFYRFAAADSASEAYRSRAISLVLAGGVIAAVLGPELAKRSVDLFVVPFSGCYLMIALLSLVCLLLLQFTRIPLPSDEERTQSGRPLGQIAAQPVFLVAVLCALVGYGAMNLVMTVTPPAMVAHGHVFGDAALVIQWHVLGMYAPSFFTGHLIRKIGVSLVLTVGALMMLGCVLVNLTGDGSIWVYSVALVLLGVGWNFLFVGGTSLLTESYRPEEKAKVQALNEFMVFGTVACTALTSGAIHAELGWQAVNVTVLFPMAVVFAVLVWFVRQRRSAAAATAN